MPSRDVNAAMRFNLAESSLRRDKEISHGRQTPAVICSGDIKKKPIHMPPIETAECSGDPEVFVGEFPQPRFD